MASPLDRIRAQLAEQAGLSLPDWVVSSRVAERAAALTIPPEAYANRIATEKAELDTLLELLRVGETRFFRHEKQTKAIAEFASTRLSDNKAVRAWSAGCASGEEAYTLAILLRKQLPSRCRVSVLGSDMSNDALAAAKRGHYSKTAAQGVPARWRDWAFETDSDGVNIRSELREMVDFEQRNLASGPYPRGFDLILCRNVLIYFTDAAKRAAGNRFAAALSPQGAVAVGYSESLSGVAKLSPLRVGDATLYVRQSAVAAAPSPKAVAPRAVKPRPPTQSPRHTAKPRSPAVDTSHVEVALTGDYSDGQRLAAELAPLLADGCESSCVDLDGASFLGDEAALILRRVVAAARASGTSVKVRAKRNSTQRWLNRSGIDGDET